MAGLLCLWLAGPVPQDPAYHCFADGRPLLGIPNFWNVLTNLPFGHVATKVALPVGAKVHLAVEGRDAFVLWGHRH